MALLGLRCCVGFSLWWLLLLQSTGSGAPGLQWLWHVGSATSELHVACSWSYQSLEHKLSSCGEAHRLSCSSTCGIFLDQGMELVSPSLVGGFFTSEPPGKPHWVTFLMWFYCTCICKKSSLGTELELFSREGNGTPLQYSCLENPVGGGAWWAEVCGVAKSRTRQSTFAFTFHFMHWRRKWQPTPVFFPGESQGWGSLVGCHLWGHTELDTTEVT